MSRLTIVLMLMIAGLLTLLAGCTPSSSFQESKLILRDHPLVNKLWDVKQQTFIDEAKLIDQLLANEYILLGERHDNLVHHQHQAWVIEYLAKAQRDVSVAFEMIDNDQGKQLANTPVTSADQLIDVLNRSETSWQYEQRYKPLFAAALAAGFQIDAANLNRTQLMQTMKQGEDKLPEAYQRMLAKTPLSEPQQAALALEVNAAHCNMLGEQTAQKMVLGQRLRDAVMADSLLSSKAQQKVLVAGSGHTRSDRGVPLYLRSHLGVQADDDRIVSIGFVEVSEDVTAVADYAAYWGRDTLPFDVAWFTPKVEREDQCAELRQHFKKEK